jgi:hypothetical protein
MSEPALKLPAKIDRLKDKARKNTANRKAKAKRNESPRPISLVVRRVEGMIRKMSTEDRQVLFDRITLLP